MLIVEENTFILGRTNRKWEEQTINTGWSSEKQTLYQFDAQKKWCVSKGLGLGVVVCSRQTMTVFCRVEHSYIHLSDKACLEHVVRAEILAL